MVALALFCSFFVLLDKVVLMAGLSVIFGRPEYRPTGRVSI
jgi:hypothetical protein